MQPYRVGRLLIPAVAIVFSSFVLYDVSLLRVLEQNTLDLRFKLRKALPADDNIVIVALDEATFRKLGIWPFPRATLASLIDRIASGKPRVIALDMLFSERRGGNTANHFSDDAVLQTAFKRAGNVILSVAFDLQKKDADLKASPQEVPDFIRNFAYLRVKPGFFVPLDAEGVLPPLKVFAEAATTLGHVSILTDQDEVLRKELLAIKYQEEYYPPLSLQIARRYLGLDPMEMVLHLGESVQLGDITIPMDEGGRMLVNYLGPSGTFKTYSAISFLEGRLSTDLFTEKIVLIGVTAVGHGELKKSPFSSIQGVEKNAHAVSTILNRRFLHRTELMKLTDIALILFYGFLFWKRLPGASALRSAALGCALLFIHVMATTLLFTRLGIWIYMVHPVGSIAVTYLGFTTYQYFVEERQARYIRLMFASYVSPRVVEEMTKRPELARVGGEQKMVTILFSDIKGFTTYCERHSPADVVRVLNQYLSAMTEVVFYWEGTLDKFVGDAIMVYWGAPLPQEDHAERAIRCALHMQDALEKLNEKLRAEGIEPFEMGVGINTGEVIVGNMGASGKKVDYTVIGDAVNIAARVEGLTRKLGVPVVITDHTYQQVKDIVDTADNPSAQPQEVKAKRIGRVLLTSFANILVKGKTEELHVFGVTGLPRQLNPSEAKSAS